MRILVTGASGLVGRALCAALSSAGHVVLRGGRCAHGPGAVVTGELGPDCAWFDGIDCPEVVVHLAARVHQMKERPEEAVALHRQANTQGTLALASRARERGVRRFIFVSTVKVNGEGRPQPYRSDDVPDPHDAYARSKADAEAGLLHMAAEGGMEIVIIRPPLVYGPGVGGNFGSLLKWMSRDCPLPLASVTDNRRSFVAVDNLVSLIALCIDHPAAAGAIWMVSDDEDVSTAELLRRMATALGRPSRLWPLPPALLTLISTLCGRRAAVQRLCGDLTVDVSATRRQLGWSPVISLDEGLRRCVSPP
ncbi:MAG: UDP-glucose 4-epimerase family protein [Pseudomonadota bacterium]